MSKGILRNPASTENVTKEKLVKAIKNSKAQFQSSDKKRTELALNILESDNSKNIEKMGSKNPSYVSLYYDSYKKYLHLVNNFCSICYLAQKKAIGKVSATDTTFPMFDAYLRSVKQMSLYQIEVSEAMMKNYIGFRHSALDSDEQMMIGITKYFTKILSNYRDSRK
jgi:hypothetical protein